MSTRRLTTEDLARFFFFFLANSKITGEWMIIGVYYGLICEISVLVRYAEQKSRVISVAMVALF